MYFFGLYLFSWVWVCWFCFTLRAFPSFFFFSLSLSPFLIFFLKRNSISMTDLQRIHSNSLILLSRVVSSFFFCFFSLSPTLCPFLPRVMCVTNSESDSCWWCDEVCFVLMWFSPLAGIQLYQTLTQPDNNWINNAIGNRYRSFSTDINKDTEHLIKMYTPTEVLDPCRVVFPSVGLTWIVVQTTIWWVFEGTGDYRSHPCNSTNRMQFKYKTVQSQRKFYNTTLLICKWQIEPDNDWAIDVLLLVIGQAG